MYFQACILELSFQVCVSVLSHCNYSSFGSRVWLQSRKKKIRDPDAPKRSRTAFNYFLDDFRGQFKMENPDSKGVVPVTRAGSIKWKVSFERMRALSVLVRIRAIQ